MAQNYQSLLDQVKKADDEYAEATAREMSAKAKLDLMVIKIKTLEKNASRLEATRDDAENNARVSENKIKDKLKAHKQVDDELKKSYAGLFEAVRGAASVDEALNALKDPVITLQNIARDAASKSCDVIQLKARFSDAKETVKTADKELSQAHKDIAAAQGRLARLQSDYDLAVEASKQAIKARDAARAAFRDVLNAGAAPFDTEVIRIISGRPGTVPHDFLTITTRDLKLARPVRIALEKLGNEFSKSRDRNAVRDACVKAGIGSEVEAITRRVNRQRLPDMRREVLARVYHEILFNRLADPGGTLAPTRARDTSGIAQSVLADLERSGGPLDKFAEILAEQSAGEMGLDAPPQSMNHAVLVARLRGGL